MWDEIFNSFWQNPRDICTCPIKGNGVWFYVWTEGFDLYVANSKEHIPSSKIKGRRRLNLKECEKMLQLYERRCRGESVSREAISASVNQVYWYGIFHALGI